MTAVRRLLAWPLWGLILVSVFLLVVQRLTDKPVMLLVALVMMVGVVTLPDPRRVALLGLIILVLGLLVPVLGHPPDGYLPRLAWLPAFALFAIGLSVIEARRIARARDENSQLKALLDATDQPVFVKAFDADGRTSYTFTNRAWSEMTGVADPVGLGDADLFSEQVVRDVSVADAQVLESGRPVTLTERVGPSPDTLRTFLVAKFPLVDGAGRTWAVAGIATDVTERERTEDQLSAVFARSPVPTLRMVTGGDRHTIVLDANEAVSRLLGADVAGFVSAQLATLIHGDDVVDTFALVDGVVAAARQARTSDEVTVTGREIRLRDRHGEIRWAVLSVSAVGAPDEGGNQELIIQFDDITARKLAEQALTERALTDSVTGLPNRYALSDRLTTAVQRLSRHPGLVCVLFCDLDNFKQVNDAFGHESGDHLLAEVGRRLSSVLRPEDTVGRQGGDEFVVVCEGLIDPTEAVLVASRLQEVLRVPWSVGGQEFRPTASIGIAFTGHADADTGDLLRQADVAMYRAKDSGRDRIQTYDRSLDDDLAVALRMQQKLRDALADDGLVVLYQPVVRLSDGALLGAEALVRLRDGDGGVLAPDTFLPHAEASGLIADVGERVLDLALTELCRWRAAGRLFDMAVNVSPTQLVQDGFAEAMLDALRRHGADPSWLVVEVTETALVQENSVVALALEQLHGAGVRIALDDFGTGYSSLSWLHEFPVDIVKIDKTFVQAMAEDHRRAVVVRAVLDISDEIGLGVVAEGVETEQQRVMLAELGCETAQGWLFGRPLPSDDPRWLADATPQD